MKRLFLVSLIALSSLAFGYSRALGQSSNDVTFILESLHQQWQPTSFPNPSSGCSTGWNPNTNVWQSYPLTCSDGFGWSDVDLIYQFSSPVYITSITVYEAVPALLLSGSSYVDVWRSL